jgi:hypothetical protein
MEDVGLDDCEIGPEAEELLHFRPADHHLTDRTGVDVAADQQLPVRCCNTDRYDVLSTMLLLASYHREMSSAICRHYVNGSNVSYLVERFYQNFLFLRKCLFL